MQRVVRFQGPANKNKPAHGEPVLLDPQRANIPIIILLHPIHHLLTKS